MPRSIPFGLALLLVVQWSPRAIATDGPPEKNRRLEIELQVTDGGRLGGVSVKQADCKSLHGPQPPEFYNIDYVWDG
jgi:hypothetical protein